jgi:hypothetical protein
LRLGRAFILYNLHKVKNTVRREHTAIAHWGRRCWRFGTSGSPRYIAGETKTL